MKKPKIFGIGVSKTGTHSLAAALKILGWEIEHFPKDKATWNDCLLHGVGPVTAAERSDGVCDIQAFAYWRELHDRYPDARYILTVRDDQSWLESTRKHFARHNPNPRLRTENAGSHYEIQLIRIAFYGCVALNEDLYLKRKKRHDSDVVEHFGSNDKLLVYNLCGGAGWGPLCAFLGLQVPETRFPHEYKAGR